jgi:hypothetical protein
VLLRLLGAAAAPWAATKLAQGVAPGDIDAARFIDTAARGAEPFKLLIKLFNDKQAAIPAGHWTALLDDPRFAIGTGAARSVAQTALAELGKRTARQIGVPWIQKSLEDRARTDAVAGWLDAGMLSGDDLDVDWLKALVGKPRLRPIALKLLGDRRRVAPARIGLRGCSSWHGRATASSRSSRSACCSRASSPRTSHTIATSSPAWRACGSWRPGARAPSRCAASRRRTSRRTTPISGRGCPRRARSASSPGSITARIH